MGMEDYGYVNKPKHQVEWSDQKNDKSKSKVQIEFCSRCNKPGHSASICKLDGRFTFQTFVCRFCKSPGHLTSECRNTAAIAQKRASLGDLFRGRPALSTTFRFNPPKGFRSSPLSASPKTNLFAQKRLYQAPALTETERQLQALKDAEAKRRARTIARELQKKGHILAAKQGGTIQLANHIIEQRAKWLYRDGKTYPDFDRLDPYVPVDADKDVHVFVEEMRKRPKALLEAYKLTKELGYNFIRDSRALDAVASGKVPVCLTCDAEERGEDAQGFMLDWLMMAVPVGADVLKLLEHEWDDYGVFVCFRCQCCKNGFDYVHPSDGLMDWQREGLATLDEE